MNRGETPLGALLLRRVSTMLSQAEQPMVYTSSAISSAARIVYKLVTHRFFQRNLLETKLIIKRLSVK